MRRPAWRRTAARAIVRDDERRILMVQVNVRGHRWLELPGGGLDPRETPEETAAREVTEETGYADVVVGPAVAHRQVLFRIGPILIDQYETFHLGRLRTPRRVAARLEAIEAANFEDVVWVHPDDLHAPVARLDPPELQTVLAGLHHDDGYDHLGAVLRLPHTDLTAVFETSTIRVGRAPT